MSLRDETEALLRGWDKLERKQGRPAIVDYDCYPEGPEAAEVTSRLQVCREANALLEQAREADDEWLTGRLQADVAYVRALLGERLPVEDYIEQTQGTPAQLWPEDYIERRKQEAIDALAALGVAWGPRTRRELEDLEGRLTAEETADEIRSEAKRLEGVVRDYVGTDAPFSLNVEEVDLDVYWAYWLDGAGPNARLRINLRHAQFTKIRARQLALHELLGHALQGASFYQQAQRADVPWVRLLSVHGPQQVLLEGLAQALPYFVAQDDEQLMARTRWVHYTQLVRGQLHLMINEPRSIEDCVAYGLNHVPTFTEAELGDALTDRANNTQLRSYLWSYPAGMDWFVTLSEEEHDHAQVLASCYEAPLQPLNLRRLRTR